MAFTLTAIPHLLPEGEHKGHLESVEFVAIAGSVKHKWSSVNVGTYAEDFAKIIPTDLARLVLSRLRNGETVTFPGLWDLEEIKNQFGGSGNDGGHRLWCYVVSKYGHQTKAAAEIQSVRLCGESGGNGGYIGKTSSSARETRVTVGNGSTLGAILTVSYSGKEVGLHVSNTELERFRVPVSHLNFVDGPRPAEPKELEKPKIDFEEVGEHLAAVHYSMVEHLQGEVAALKNWPSGNGDSAGDTLDEFAGATETSRKEAVEVIEGSLESSVPQPSTHQQAFNPYRRAWKCARTP